MAKLHDKGSKAQVRAVDPEGLLHLLQTFISDCTNPVALEPGDDPMALRKGSYAVDASPTHVVLELWDDHRSITRRIIHAEKKSSGVLECTILRFAGAIGQLTILDTDRPQTSHRVLRGNRETFAQQFRRMLNRLFPGWEIASLSSSPDLQRSFSPVFPRARLICGNRVMAALACPDAQSESALLSFALIWFDHVRQQAPLGTRASLTLFVPEGCGTLTAHRLRSLACDALSAKIFVFNENGSAGEVDASDLGNIETRVSEQYAEVTSTPDLQDFLRQLTKDPCFGCSPELDGSLSIRFRGLEFARIESGRILLGIEQPEILVRSGIEQVRRFAAQLAAVGRSTDDVRNSGLPAFPERWLESQVRRNINVIDAGLLPSPVHGQVLTLAAGDRDLIDLLAISFAGRLAVVELKCSPDIHLPLQALDYWTRIKHHAERRELAHLFSSTIIQSEPPKLLLVAPAIAFHPSNQVVLRYFSPKIEVERVGVNSHWRDELRVVMRLQGANVPQSHLWSGDEF